MNKKIGLLLAILIALFLGFNIINQILTTLKSSDKLQVATQTLYELDLKNKKLKERLNEVKSPYFVEKEARDKLGLSKDGETVIIIEDKKLTSVLGTETPKDEPRLPNWLGWWKVFF